jgi:hypothetical protein
VAGEWFRSGWRCVLTEPQVVHVIPVGDVVPHEKTEDCVCGPRVEIEPVPDAPDGHVVVHHSLDGREQSERTA